MNTELDSKKIFISYSHKDSTLAKGIAGFLERRNCDVWIDYARIKEGDSWADGIDAAIDRSDFVIGVLTRDSVARPEVIRELVRALNKSEADGESSLILCAVGQIHDSWFYAPENADSKRVVDYFHKYQHIAFNARAAVTTEEMSALLSCIRAGRVDKSYVTATGGEGAREYVNIAGTPAKRLYGDGDSYFYRVYNNDLSPSTVYPFALDNQWIPRQITEKSELRSRFVNKGFSDEEIAKVIAEAQVEHLKVSLINARQIIVNNAAILNSRGIRRFYAKNSDPGDDGDCLSKERAAFATFLEDGSIVVFLYGRNEKTPHVDERPVYETDQGAVDGWNELCDSCHIYCIREDWYSDIDQHSIDFARFCCTISDDPEQSKLLAKSLGIADNDVQHFLAILKDVSVQGFVRTRLTGSNVYDAMTGLSRSYFYGNFIVRKEEGDLKPVLNCLFDTNKPFHRELKSIVDVFYNSLFTNYFQCREMLPLDEPPTNSFLNQLYLAHGKRQVSEQELEYAISEFLEAHTAPASFLEGRSDKDSSRTLLRRALCTGFWSLDRIRQLRDSSGWLEYIDTTETSFSRIQEWCIDFADVSKAGSLLYKALWTSANEICSNDPKVACGSVVSEDELPPSRSILDCSSLRICIGTRVIDAVVGIGNRRLAVYSGDFNSDENHLIVYYQPGAIDYAGKSDTVLMPMKVFDGITSPNRSTDVKFEDYYFGGLLTFLKEQGFEEVSV